MQPNILFDNIYIGHSVEDARALADQSFFLKHPIEEIAELADRPKEEEKPVPKSPSDLKFLDDPVLYVREKLDLFVTLAKKDPIQAVQFMPEVAGALGAILVSLIAVTAGVLSLGGSPAPAAKKVAADAKATAKDIKDKVADAATTGADTAKAELNKRTTRSHS